MSKPALRFDAQTFSTILLQIRCVAGRVNPVAIVSFGLFVFGMAMLALWLPYQEKNLGNKQAEVERVEHLNKSSATKLVAMPSQNETRVSQFYATLGEDGYAEQQLKTFFDIAGKDGLKLNQGEYKVSYERNSDTVAYQIELPVTGPYRTIRQFCEEVLLAIPFASLDEISFKREAISSANLDAKLKFTLYLSATKYVAMVQP